MIALLAASLVAGLPQTQVETLCSIVRHRQEYLHERDAWDKAWIYLSFGGTDLRPQDKREIKAFCRRGK